ncbi:sorting nexin-8-like isoform X2 [Neocloeon triangulifer]|uniref:sorting nexin-8-like isoform X2 n=1 Tax=Neocloeon triangulifer TaxID=2078957 RepID=UPI00286F0C72|nr:sorting nexin-8-like isoform X2 [Neocloeon triangulifer]
MAAATNGNISTQNSNGEKMVKEGAKDYLTGLSYTKLFEYDSIEIDLAPEKKGIFNTYQEYFVKSKRLASCVERRYTDFVSFHEILIATYPYRLVPKLPPKKMMGVDVKFIEERRRALRRWLTLVSQHPVLSEDPTTRFFLTFTGPKVHSKILEVYKRMPDEFTTSFDASKSKELVESVSPSLIASSRSQIQVIFAGVSQLRTVAERIAQRSQDYALDVAEIGIQMLKMANDPQSASEWAASGSNVWEETKVGFKAIANDFSDLYTQANNQAMVQQEEVCEKLNLLLDLLTAHQMLCERHEKGVAQDHQRALDKMLAFKKAKIQKSISGSEGETLDQLEARMMEQESVIADIEMRSAYSLHCMKLETQLVHTYLGIVTEIMSSLISVQVIGHSEMAKVWKTMQTKSSENLPDI